MKLPPHALHSKDVIPKAPITDPPIIPLLVPSDIVAVSMAIVVASMNIVVELTSILVLSTPLLPIIPSSTLHLKEEKQATNKPLPLPRKRVKTPPHLLPSTIPMRALDTVDSSPSALEGDIMEDSTTAPMVDLADNIPSLRTNPSHAMDLLASLLMVLSLPLAIPPLKPTLPSHPRVKERTGKRDSVSSA